MTQFLLLRRFVAVAAFCFAAVAAHADVLEIGANGAQWVAGGPPRTMSAFAADKNQVNAALTSGTPSLAPREWQGHLAAIAARHDISPALLEAVVWQESRWRPGAVSRAGARGLTQLMPATARDLGVNPDDPWANLEGGARYLRAQLNAFDGDLVKALAAYNAGPGRVIRAGGVPRIRETQDYVAAILNRLSQPVRR